MANATLADVQIRMSPTTIEKLCQPDGVAEVVAAAIADSDAEMVGYVVSTWGAEQKRAASVAFTRERLYMRHGTGKVPQSIADEAQRWRVRMEDQQGMWTQVSFDPTRRETAAELNRLLTGDQTWEEPS